MPKILGVYLDTSLSFNKHSGYIAERVSSWKNILKRWNTQSYYLHSIWQDVWNREMSATPITTRETPKRQMKETQFTRHRNTVKPMMLADNRKATLQGIHTDAVNKAVKDQKKNIVIDDLLQPINNSLKKLNRNKRATLAQLRYGYCKLLCSYKCRIKSVPTAARRHMTSSISLLAQLIRRH